MQRQRNLADRSRLTEGGHGRADRVCTKEPLRGAGAPFDYSPMSRPNFRVIEPTRAFLQAERPPASQEGSWASEITVDPGTRLRYRCAGGYADACSAIFMDWDEFDLLDGAWAGQAIWIEDAGTLRDEYGRSTHWGWRPRLGPPPSIVADPPLPLDWRWRVVP
jgi:hypothetical protein